MSHALAPRLASQKAGSIGTLLPNLEARLVLDGEENDELVDADVGEPGELWIRGPTIMKVIWSVQTLIILDLTSEQGYLNNPKATEDCITLDGWFKTGDICVRDADGIYWIVDRRKELIKYKVMSNNLYFQRSSGTFTDITCSGIPRCARMLQKEPFG